MRCKHIYILKQNTTYCNVYCCKCGKHNRIMERKIDKLKLNTHIYLMSKPTMPEEYWAIMGEE